MDCGSHQHNKNMDKVLSNKKAIFLFMLPACVIYLAIMLIPIISTIVLSFCKWNSISPPSFVGFGNYIKLLTNDRVMKIAVKNSLFIVVFSLATQQTIGLAVAAILSAKGRKFKNFYKNIYYLPSVISSAALALLFSFLLNPNMGINALLAKVGIKGPLWLMDVSWSIPLPLWVIGFIALWQYMGSNMMLYMAAIAGIPDSYYDAAQIDGASKSQSFFYITLPLIKPMAKISITMSCIGSLKFFDLIYNMTNGGPSHLTEVMATYLYSQAFGSMKFGYASAISICIMLMCLIVSGIVNKVMRVDDFSMS